MESTLGGDEDLGPGSKDVGENVAAVQGLFALGFSFKNMSQLLKCGVVAVADELQLPSKACLQ